MVGCFATAPAEPTTASPTKQFQDFMTNQATINAKAEKDEKAQNELLAQAQKDITDLKSKVGTGGSSGYTTQQVDAKFQQFISNLSQADIDVLKGKLGVTSMGTGTGTNPITGSVTFTVNPTPLNPLFSGQYSGQAMYYTLNVVNGTNSWQYIQPSIRFSLASGSAPTGINSLAITISSGQGNISQSYSSLGQANSTWSGHPTCDVCPTGVACFSCPNQISLSPIVYGYMPTTSVSSIIAVPILGGVNNQGEFQLGPAQSMSMNISIANFNTVNTATWNITNTISNRSMY